MVVSANPWEKVHVPTSVQVENEPKPELDLDDPWKNAQMEEKEPSPPPQADYSISGTDNWGVDDDRFTSSASSLTTVSSLSSYQSLVTSSLSNDLAQDYSSNSISTLPKSSTPSLPAEALASFANSDDIATSITSLKSSFKDDNTTTLTSSIPISLSSQSVKSSVPTYASNPWDSNYESSPKQISSLMASDPWGASSQSSSQSISSSSLPTSTTLTSTTLTSTTLTSIPSSTSTSTSTLKSNFVEINPFAAPDVNPFASSNGNPYSSSFADPFKAGTTSTPTSTTSSLTNPNPISTTSVAPASTNLFGAIDDFDPWKS